MSFRGRRHGSRDAATDRSRSVAATATPAAPSAADLLAEAEAMQQRAERRKGDAAIQAYSQAAALYRRSLGLGLAGTDEQLNALFSLGECLQLWADALSEAARKLPDDQLSPQVEQDAASSSCRLYEEAVGMYRRVQAPAGATSGGPTAAPSADPGMREDAAVNCGNTLCSWAELLQDSAAQDRVGQAGMATAGALLQAAVAAYKDALAREEDALTWGNLADALLQQGEVALAAGRTQQGEGCFADALRAYERSCSLTDSESGDDLPGLLHNWGVGLLTMSKHAQDATFKLSLLEQAAQRLRHSISFSRGDVAPANALGDVLMARAEALGSIPTLGQAQRAQQRQQQAEAAATAAAEGYMAALTISRHNTDALVGLAEVSVYLGKLAVQVPDAAAAQAHFNEAMAHYAAALRHPIELGGLSDRQEVRYNYACACALTGREQEARQVLQQLAAAGALNPVELKADADFAVVGGAAWFQELLAAVGG